MARTVEIGIPKQGGKFKEIMLSHSHDIIYMIE